MKITLTYNKKQGVETFETDEKADEFIGKFIDKLEVKEFIKGIKEIINEIKRL